MTESTSVESNAPYLTPEQLEQIENDEMPDEEFGELMFRQLMDSEALLSPGESFGLEKAFTGDNWGVVRRTALTMLTKPGKEVVEMFRDDRDFAVGMVPIYEGLAEYPRLLREFADYMEESHKRMMLAYCIREDMKAVFEEGRRQEGNSNGQ